MRVHREALACVEQLDQDARRRAEARDVLLAEPGDRIGRDGVAEQASVGESRQAFLGVRAARVVRRSDGSDPLLREEPVLGPLAAQLCDERTAAIEAMDAGRCQPDGVHESAADVLGRQQRVARVEARARTCRERLTCRHVPAE